MGWDATGFLVYLGSAESVEKSERYIYAGDQLIGVVPQTRTVTQQRGQWRGLTAAGAASKAASEGYSVIARDRVGESGQWTVTEEKLTYGEWVDEEEPEE